MHDLSSSPRLVDLVVGLAQPSRRAAKKPDDQDDRGAPEKDYESISFNSALDKRLAGEYNNAVF